jgi:lactose/L-arabinose transport system substrate-binding protein
MQNSVTTLPMAAILAATTALPAAGQNTDISGDITIWSWNIAAAALTEVVPGFNESYPNVTVTVQDLGNQQVFDRMLAGCAAGGTDLPDIVSVENREAEIFWAQFPDCFTDLRDLGYDDELAAQFPDFERTELEVGDVRYAMPWDSGPVAMFYRRDHYEAAGVDPSTIETWDDFIEAGLAIQAANDGVSMTQGNLDGDTEWFLMMANEQGCMYFSNDGESITITQPGCVAALETLKNMVDAGVLTAADWVDKIQSSNAGTVATHMYGGWYEGTMRSNAEAGQEGLWGVYRMPSMTADGVRAANLGGSSLAIPANSDNKEAAYAFVEYALTTVEGQVVMLKTNGLVPSLIAALDDPYIDEGIEFWGGQPVWQTILATLPDVIPVRGTPYFEDADNIMQTVQTKYLNGGYDSAEAAMADAASQIELVTGLPIAE